MPRAPVTIATAIIPPTNMVSSAVSFSGIAVSRTSRSRNGGTIPSPAETRISPSSPASGRRYGRNSRATRRTGCRTARASSSSGKRGRRCRLEREVEDLTDGHDRMKLHLRADLLRYIIQVGAIALGKDHVRQAGRVRGEHLLLQ